jgi:cellulose synthase/poly-beta-1,6-N-acetylglucosamine synthase-like glycosyltransferase
MAYGTEYGADRGRTEVGRASYRDDAAVFVLPRSPPADRIGSGRPRRQSAFPELDCVRGTLPPHLIAAVEHRASEIGVSAERVLIAAGYMDEDNYVYTLAKSLGLAYETFDDRDRLSCSLADDRLLLAARVGLLPLTIDGEEEFVVAPSSARQFLRSFALGPHARFRLTSSARLNLFIIEKGGAAVAHEATSGLRSRAPVLSAGCSHHPFRLALVALMLSVLAAFAVFPSTAIVAVESFLAVAFLAALGLRLIGSYLPAPPTPTERIPDRELPVYTVIVAMYHEASAVKDLIRSLRALHYPPEKLDIKLVLEPDDLETWDVLASLKLGAPFEIMFAPYGAPRTKPKALNTALLFARGTYVVVYDAEDRPEPDQLHKALAIFNAENDSLACVQAALTIDNTDDSWLTSLFTAEYAAQFDLFLPGLARLGLPLPLGGSSNHFRTLALRRAGAWDPFNVTEDADLGMRLARFGYRTTVVSSTTDEEAPADLRSWTHQRTRWFKGWIQTWAVHMRTPLALFRELGPWGFLTFQLVVGGNVLSALIHPVFLVSLVWALVAGHPLLGGENQSLTLTLLFGMSLGSGYLLSIVLGLRGLARRRLLTYTWDLAFVPAHWAILSFAAWRALYKLFRDPQGWEKTPHGLAKSSRRAIAMDGKPADVSADVEPRLQTAA